MSDGGALAAGVVLGTASMLSIGPNNLLLIREGLIRGRVAFVATFVFASYLLFLITAFFLSDTITAGLSHYRLAITWLGLAAISSFALSALKSSWKYSSKSTVNSTKIERSSETILRLLGTVFLNPLTYVELLIIPAAICGTFADVNMRLQFLLGILIVKFIACYGYSFGARSLASIINSKRSLQVFDLSSGVLLSGLAAYLAVGLIAQ